MARIFCFCTGLVLASWFVQSAAYAQTRTAASIKPVHAIVSAVMNGVDSPKLILSGNASPHHTALKPSQRRIIEAANIIFHIGGGLERRLVKPLDQRKTAGALVVALIETPGLVLLPIRIGGIWPEDEHGQGDDHDTNDPHIWLDPQNAKAMTRHIASVLAKADPGNAAAYQSNAERFSQNIERLKADITARLTQVRSKPFIVFHDGYQYFEKRFGLIAAGAITIDPDKRPGARRLRDIRRVIAERGASCVFVEPQFEIGYVATVIEGTSARSAQLDPIGADLEISPGSYIKLMSNMAHNIAECLADSP